MKVFTERNPHRCEAEGWVARSGLVILFCIIHRRCKITVLRVYYQLRAGYGAVTNERWCGRDELRRHQTDNRRHPGPVMSARLHDGLVRAEIPSESVPVVIGP